MPDKILKRIEAENEESPLWIVGKETGSFLNMMVRVFKPENVLEIGTCVGYSAIWIAKALEANQAGYLWTIESKTERFERAKINIAESGLSSRITIIKHHAPEVFSDPNVQIPEQIDLLFFDATKKQHTEFYEALKPNLKKGSILIVDNVQSHKESFEGFLEFLKENPDFETWELGIGAGLLIARKV